MKPARPGTYGNDHRPGGGYVRKGKQQPKFKVQKFELVKKKPKRNYVISLLNEHAKKVMAQSPLTERVRKKAPATPDPFRKPPETMRPIEGAWLNGRALSP